MAASSIAAALGRAGRLDAARGLFPGVLACGVVAAAATFLSQHYGAPDAVPRGAGARIAALDAFNACLNEFAH